MICAPSAASSGGRWFVGSFVQTLPPIVPRFRTCTSAICAQTSPRIGRARASLDSTISVYVVIAPIDERAVGAELDPLQLLDAAQVDERVGRAGARLHHVDQRLAAGERARAVVRREQLDRFGERGGPRISDLAKKHPQRGLIKCQESGARCHRS